MQVGGLGTAVAGDAIAVGSVADRCLLSGGVIQTSHFEGVRTAFDPEPSITGWRRLCARNWIDARPVAHRHKSNRQQHRLHLDDRSLEGADGPRGSNLPLHPVDPDQPYRS